MSAPVYPVTRSYFEAAREVQVPAAALEHLQKALLWLGVTRGPQSSAEVQAFLVRRGLAVPQQAYAVAWCGFQSLRNHAAGRLMDDDFFRYEQGEPVRRFVTAEGHAYVAMLREQKREAA